MNIREWLTLFFGGGGLISLLTVVLSKRKTRDEQKFDIVKRLADEVTRLDITVKDLRRLLSESEKEADDSREALNDEREKNHQLSILVMRLESNIVDLKAEIEKLKGEEKK